MNPLSRLARTTYALQHNPNCPKPYLIRLIGKGRGRLDLAAYERTGDRLCFGKTLKEAVQLAVSK